MGGVVEVECPEKITQATIDKYFIDNTIGMKKYFEYEGRYYRIMGVHAD
ncbi:hypothetical protein [Methanofollis fontis]|nr:hypothetical protein [Methanofollis fontis]